MGHTAADNEDSEITHSETGMPPLLLALADAFGSRFLRGTSLQTLIKRQTSVNSAQAPYMACQLCF
jgi:hypothetical protein